MRSFLKQDFFNKYGENHNEKWFSTKEARIHFRKVCLQEAEQDYSSWCAADKKNIKKFGSCSKWRDETIKRLKQYILEAKESLQKAKNGEEEE